MIKLYGDRLWISPYFYSAYVALKELGLPFEVVEVGLERADNLRAPLAEKLVTGRIPTLEEADFSLAESSAIAEYLDEEFGSSAALLPKARKDRARARMLMAWLRSDLGALRDELSTATMFYTELRNPVLSDKGRTAADRLVRVASSAVREGTDTLFERWCLADNELAFMLKRLILNGHPVPERLEAYARRQWQRPSSREFTDRKRPAYVAY